MPDLSRFHQFGGRQTHPNKRIQSAKYLPVLDFLEDRVAPAINVAVVGVGGPASEDFGFSETVLQLNDDTHFDFNATLVAADDVDELTELQQYDVVVIGNNGTNPDRGDTFALFDDALQSWVTNYSGGVVAVGQTVFGVIRSAETGIDAVVPVQALASGSVINGGLLDFAKTIHPVTVGLADTTIPSAIEYPSAGADAAGIILATTSGRPTAVVQNVGYGRGVYLGPAYASSVDSVDQDALRTGVPDRLLEQAVAWAAGPDVEILEVTPDPRTTPVSSVLLNIRKDINMSTFDAADVTLTLDSGPNLINAGVTVTHFKNNIYRINGLSALTEDGGTYKLSITGAGIDDTGGNPLSGSATESGVSKPNATRVAVIGSGNPTNDAGFQAIVDQLNDATRFDFVAEYVHPVAVDTVKELELFDVAVIGNNFTAAGDQFSRFDDALRSWVLNGGGVVATGWTVYGVTSGVENGIDAVVPVVANGRYRAFSSANIVITNTTHPVTQGLRSFATGSPAEAPLNGANSGTTILGTVSGAPNIVVDTFAYGRGVYLGSAYADHQISTTTRLRSGLADLLLEQAVAWADVPDIDVLDVSPDPNPGGVDTVDVFLLPDINLTTFTAEDVTLTRNNGPNLIDAGVTVSHVSGKTYRISGLADLTFEDGTYELTVDGSGIEDTLRRPLNVSDSDTWFVDNGPPTVVSTTPEDGSRNVDALFQSMTVKFNQQVSTASAEDVANYKLSGPNGDVAIASAVLGADAKTVTLSFAVQTTDGEYSLRVGGVSDLNGDSMNPLGGYEVTFSYSVAGPHAFTLGDYDEDGNLDVVVSRYNDTSYLFFKGLGDGRFAAPVASANSGSYRKEVISADINGDGHLDLISPMYSTRDAFISVNFGHGNGRFTNSFTLVAPRVYSVAVADVDGDNNLDLVGAGVVSGSGLRTFLNPGHNRQDLSGWTDVQFSSGSPAMNDIHLADVSGDGIVDAITTSTTTGNVWLGQGDGSFDTPLKIAITGADLRTTLVDVNGDNLPDLVTGNSSPTNITYGSATLFLRPRFDHRNGWFKLLPHSRRRPGWRWQNGSVQGRPRGWQGLHQFESRQRHQWDCPLYPPCLGLEQQRSCLHTRDDGWRPQRRRQTGNHRDLYDKFFRSLQRESVCSGRRRNRIHL